MPMMKNTMITLIGYISSFKVVTMNIKSHQRWIKEINKYINNQTDEEVIKFALSYTLQSLRANENMERFKWKE